MSEKKVKPKKKHIRCSTPASQTDKECSKNAAYVCHHCGAPLCERCVVIAADHEFIGSGKSWSMFALAVSVITVAILVPVIIRNSISTLWGLSIAVSGIITGISIIFTLRYQPKFIPVRRIYNEAAHCNKCLLTHRAQNIIDKALLTIGVLMVAYGIYESAWNTHAAFLILISAGVAIVLMRRDIAHSKS